MGIGIIDALAPKPFPHTMTPQQIIGVIDLMAALAQYGAAVPLTDALCSGLHACCVRDGQSREDFRLWNIGGQHLCHRQQPGQCFHGIRPQELCPGGGHHHRVHHDMLCAVLL